MHAKVNKVGIVSVLIEIGPEKDARLPYCFFEIAAKRNVRVKKILHKVSYNVSYMFSPGVEPQQEVPGLFSMKNKDLRLQNNLT